jgi:hypothetical protein
MVPFLWAPPANQSCSLVHLSHADISCVAMRRVPPSLCIFLLLCVVGIVMTYLAFYVLLSPGCPYIQSCDVGLPAWHDQPCKCDRQEL